jgi:predicted nucleic acid-binding protein
MRAVLDTNVLISSVISTGVPHEIVVKGFSSEYQIIVSVATLTEFRDTLLKYPEKFHMDEEDVQEEVETIRYFADCRRRVRRSDTCCRKAIRWGK